jgi:cardiolipin synthase (CMP-forming)
MSDRAASASWQIATVPNVISVLRLCAVPVAVWLVLDGALRQAFGLFVIAGVSDAVDGWLARRGAASVLGAVLDPLADKALLIGMFLSLGALGIVPDELAWLVVARDVVIVGGAAAMVGLGMPLVIRPLLVSKLNTVLQIVLVGVALFLVGFGRSAPLLMHGLEVAVLLSTLLSGLAYGWSTARRWA